MILFIFRDIELISNSLGHIHTSVCLSGFLILVVSPVLNKDNTEPSFLRLFDHPSPSLIHLMGTTLAPQDGRWNLIRV